MEADLARIRARLADLDTERHVLHRELKALEILLTTEQVPAAKQLSFENSPVTNTSSSREKVNLFRRLFAGRPDVFPIRWDNKKTGRSGYSPACANEWVKGICEKPKVKCGACPRQKFIPHDEKMIEKHLRGDFVAGVYHAAWRLWKPDRAALPEQRARLATVSLSMQTCDHTTTSGLICRPYRDCRENRWPTSSQLRNFPGGYWAYECQLMTSRLTNPGRCLHPAAAHSVPSMCPSQSPSR